MCHDRQTYSSIRQYNGAFSPWSIGFLARHVGLNQAKGYPPRLSMEVVIVRKKRGSRQLMEQHDDSVIGESLVSHIDADLTHRDSPTAQELSLMLGDVLVEEVHPATSVGS